MRPGSACVAGPAAVQGRLRPQSAALLQLQSQNRGNPASSDELIRDLEAKVRRVVELKRTESDRLRFTVAKKREDVERARLALGDLLKDCAALGLADKQLDERERLQPVVSVSRRPVYAKRTNISELERKLERRNAEAHEVLRATLVLEHIKKRLLAERTEQAVAANDLKAQFAELEHQTHELHKKDIAASDAVSQAQARLAQQKADMALSAREYRRELEMRQKWAREKAKFDKYYNDQILALQREASSPLGFSDVGTISRRKGSLPSTDQIEPANQQEDDELRESCRHAFLRMGFGHNDEPIDPRVVVQTVLQHQELLRELDNQCSKDAERIAQLQKQIAQAKSIATETIPLSKRGTSQRLESRELELSSVERALATVVDQFMFVDQSVRPIKIGLQQILQNVRNEAVNADDIEELERLLTESCEEMMRLVREPDEVQPQGNDRTEETPAPFAPEQLTSPFNVRVPPKARTPYFVLGISSDMAVRASEDGADLEEPDPTVMDRATVKRISSVLASSKRPRDGD